MSDDLVSDKQLIRLLQRRLRKAKAAVTELQATNVDLERRLVEALTNPVVADPAERPVPELP